VPLPGVMPAILIGRLVPLLQGVSPAGGPPDGA
jgi:hypothetical protein